MKCATVAIVGRPSAGKSSLLNFLTGQKVSITAAVPQTTRNKIRGILTEDAGQLVFIDTPGLHDSAKKFNLRLKDLAGSALAETDMALYVIDISRLPGAEEEAIAARLARFPGAVVAALNKTDIASGHREENLSFIASRLPQAEIFPVSARTGEGIAALKDKLFTLAPEGEALYPPDYYTDQEPEFRASEIIREKAIAEIRAEVPHALYVEIADIEAREEEEPPRGNKKSGAAGKGEAARQERKTRAALWLRAFIIVETESQKGILVGSGGNKIKTIRVAAQKELGKIFPYRIQLDLRVKTRPRWRRQDGLLKKLLR
ncbi:MAG: GTPase Era [Spirochaetales bacterium]|jgi:GTP-binding protein Era|nr:GTPase Era [Spirochaetales bacterium]